MASRPETEALQRIAATRITAFFEALTPERLGELETFYTAGVYFKDPFNEVRGVSNVRDVFKHMYRALHEPRFIVTASIVDGDQCFLSWNFEFYFKRFDTRTLQTIRGGSHLKFTDGGLVDYHRDYWDAAEELYEKLPAIGKLMRWLKNRARQ